MCTLYILSELILMTNVVTYKCNKNLMKKWNPVFSNYLSCFIEEEFMQMKQQNFYSLFIFWKTLNQKSLQISFLNL